MAPMHLEVTTAERNVYSDEVDMVIAQGAEGELGILPHHAPLMTTLQPGELIIRKGGEETYLAVSGGFLEVMGNAVTVLADACERSEEIDEERASQAIEQARDRLAMRAADIDLEQAMATVRRAETRLRVARRRQRREGAPTSQEPRL